MATENPESPPSKQARGRREWVILVLAAVTVFLAVYVGTQVVGVLYSMAFPPSPPLIEGATEIQHTSEAYGVDEWQYSIADDACRVVRYYEAQGGICDIAPQSCASGFVDPSQVTPGSNIAQCRGEIDFSIFAMRWDMVIAAGYREGDQTRFILSREIFWTGEVPPPMFATEEPLP